MVYYVLMMLARVVPGQARRQRFTDWARARFSVRAIVDAALDEQRAALERIMYRAQMVDTPLILTVDQTIDALIDGKSIARFGAGELWTMEGGVELQTPSAELTQRMREVLTSEETGLLIGIPSFTYELSPELSSGMRDYCLRTAPELRRILRPYLRTGTVYAATEVSLAHTSFRAGFDRRAYFEKCRRIWEGADVTLIHGEGIFDGLRHDIFDNAASVEHLLAPRLNAFDQYGEILGRAMQVSKDRLIIAVLGPSATVLAYDLHRAGYRVLDLGHIAKSYDWWRADRPIHPTAANKEFFAPD